MKKSVYLAIFALTFGLCAGCGNKEADSDISGTEDTVFQTEEPLELSGTGNIDLSEENKDSGGENADSSEENNGSGEEDTDIESTDTQEIDFTRDYSEDIKKDVDDVVSASASLQEELENIHTLSEQYEAIAQTAQTQGEMNMSSGWFLKIWDTELNNLWSRFSDSADEGKSPRRAEKLELHERRSGAGEPWFQRRKREHVLASCELFSGRNYKKQSLRPCK